MRIIFCQIYQDRNHIRLYHNHYHYHLGYISHISLSISSISQVVRCRVIILVLAIPTVLATFFQLFIVRFIVQ